MLPQFGGQRVCLVGQILAQSDDLATVQCSGGHQVQVQKSPGAHYGAAFVEVVGIAAADGSMAVREERAVDMGDNFDLANYDQVVWFPSARRALCFFSTPTPCSVG